MKFIVWYFKICLHNSTKIPVRCLAMDPRYSAQDVLQCNLWRMASPPMYCDFCQIHQCKICIGEHLSGIRLYEILKMSFNRQWTTAKLKKNSQSYVSFIVNNETFLFVYSVFLPKTPRSFIYWHGQSWNKYSCFKERDLKKIEKSVYPKY